jgi:cytochrome c oxidase subunit IV
MAIAERPMAEHHVPSIKTYIYVFLALLVGTGLTVLAAEFDLGPLNNVVALGIAGTKATIVGLYFMHLRHSTKMSILSALAGVFWLFLMIGMFMLDYGSRVASVLPVPGK